VFVDRLREGDAEGVTDGDAALLGRDGCEGGRAEHVAGGETPRAVVAKCSSTTIRPRSSSWTPASTSTSDSVLPTRPATNSTLSCSLDRPPSFTCTRPSTRATLACPQLVIARIPIPTNVSSRTRDSPWFSNGAMRLAASIRVTSTPSTVKIDAYSAPTAPAPITARLEGIRSRSRIESESCPSGSSNGLFTVDRDGAVTQQPRASTDAFDALTLEVGRDRGGHRLLNLGGPVSEPLERELRRDL
jgi:hypothetical protein